jgi:hypothetical protein
MTQQALATAPSRQGPPLLSDSLEPNEFTPCALCGAPVDEEAWQRDVWDRIVHERCAAARSRSARPGAA